MDIVTRSVPMGSNGLPLDPNLRMVDIGANAPVGAMEGKEDEASIDLPAFIKNASPFSVKDLEASVQQAAENAPKLASLPSNLPATAAKTPSAQSKVTAKFIRPDATIKIPLDWPIEYDGVEYHELTLRVVRGKDVERFQGLLEEHGGSIAMLATMADIPPDVAASLSSDDMENALQKGLPFMPRSMRKAIAAAMADPETGDTPASSIGTNTPGSPAVSSDGPSENSET